MLLVVGLGITVATVILRPGGYFFVAGTPIVAGIALIATALRRS